MNLPLFSPSLLLLTLISLSLVLAGPIDTATPSTDLIPTSTTTVFTGLEARADAPPAPAASDARMLREGDDTKCSSYLSGIHKKRYCKTGTKSKNPFDWGWYKCPDAAQQAYDALKKDKKKIACTCTVSYPTKYDKKPPKLQKDVETTCDYTAKP